MTPHGQRLGVSVWNFRNGGLREGRYEFGPAVAALVTRPEYLDLLVLCEAKEYAWRGGAGMHQFTSLLAQATGRALAPLLGTLCRGEFGPMLVYDAHRLLIERWYGYGIPHVPTDKRNWCVARLRESQTRFGVLPVHWPLIPDLRRIEAEMISWVAGLPFPVLVAGDINGIASGEETERDFAAAPAHRRRHKAHLVSGRWVPETSALDLLLGRWDSHTRSRVDGAGLYDLAEIAAHRHGEAHALRPTTRHGRRDGVRIDRGLVNSAAADALVPGTFLVETPSPPQSDHDIVRFTLRLSGEPVGTAP